MHSKTNNKKHCTRQLITAAAIVLSTGLLSACRQANAPEYSWPEPPAEMTAAADTAMTHANTMQPGTDNGHTAVLDAFVGELTDLRFMSNQEIPPVGTTIDDFRYFVSLPDSSGKCLAYSAPMKNISLPEFGISSICVLVALFPDDESKVIYEGSVDSTIDFADIGIKETDRACIDISAMYPGSLTRVSVSDFFQTYRFTLDEPLKDADFRELTARELMKKLYPYDMDLFLKDDGELSGVSQYHALEDQAAGCLYIVFRNTEEPGAGRIRMNGDNDRKSGFSVFRIKGSSCTAVLYRTNMEINSLLRPAFVLGRSLTFNKEES